MIIVIRDYCVIYRYYLILASIVSIFIGLIILILDEGYYFDWSIIYSYSSEFYFSLVLDWISFIFNFFVLFISSCVIYYRTEYIGNDGTKNRFAILVFIFVVSILLVINRYSLVGLLLGWDGLGLVSYCLVIYYCNVRSYNAGIITILFNRIGDAALLLAISWLVVSCDWNYVCFYDWRETNIWVIFLCLLAGCTKRAQIPFSAWLPAAIAAPTPVSALVHSSTLVTAGVYLIIRFGNFENVYITSYKILCLLSLMTIFIAGIGANFEYDLKKIIALSTLRQLGLMIFILSLGIVKLAYFHLLTHAIFKALLFLCAGSFIHATIDTQDIRIIGRIINYSPVVATRISIARYALIGFPFLAGFYSKDLIIEIYLFFGVNWFIFVVLMLSVGLTACYSIRLGYYCLWKNNSWKSRIQISDGGLYILKPIRILRIMALISGSLMIWLLFPIPRVIILNMSLKIFAVIMTGMGVILGLLIFWGCKMKRNIYFDFFASIWFLSRMRGQFIIKNLMYNGKNMINFCDKGWLEYFGGYGVYSNFNNLSANNQWWQNNSFKIYLFFLLFWVFIFIIH